MARQSFRMPQNFQKFPECPNCNCKNFTRIKIVGPEGCDTEEVFYYLKCDQCEIIYSEEQLEITNETVTEEKIIHQHIKDWNSPQQRNKVAETVAEMEARGDTVKRIRAPHEL